MSIRTRIAIAAGIVAAVAALAATALFRETQPVVVEGAVLLSSAEVDQQSPISGVDVTVAKGRLSASGRSDGAGFFRLVLPQGIRKGDSIRLRFYHAAYRPLEMRARAGDELPVARLAPLVVPPPQRRSPHATAVANMRIRYSIAVANTIDIGTGVKMFETANRGNVPCDDRKPCSPDGRWKAGIGAASLDAGPDNRFTNVRVSCIAGPCPFTRIDSNTFSAGGRRIAVTARDWSDTATFVLQAEVVRVENSDEVRYVYPVVLGRTMNFTLPAAAQGPSIEAEVAGTPIVFPLGPRLVLSWATCDARMDNNQSKVYRCELKPAYRF